MSNLPLVYEIEDNEKALLDFREKMEAERESVKNIILNYPTVYIHSCKRNGQYEVYVGETSDIIRRTRQHYEAAKNGDENCWQRKFQDNPSSLFIIGHDHFNKSLTLDIENKLMLYLTGVKQIKQIHNARGNEQNQYYTSDEFDDIFSKIWRSLYRQNSVLFPAESVVKDSALYKASPLHKLTEEQKDAKDKIVCRVRESLKKDQKGQLVFVAGSAGTGKSVLISSLFYELTAEAEELNMDEVKCYLLVNHDEQLVVYQQIAAKLGLNKKWEDVVCKPTRFINTHSENDVADIILVDEAHLLWTQGKQAYRGKNQLDDLKARAKVVVMIFDERQILRTEQYWEAQPLASMVGKAKEDDSYIELKNQLRMNADEKTINWIHDFIDKGVIGKIPRDSKGYEIAIYDTPDKLQKEIEKKARRKETSLSRIIATFDWAYNDKKMPPNPQKHWEVMIGRWKMPWNKQLEPPKEEKFHVKKLAWAEKPYTIGEVGSTFTIQGFDLNFAGVILGPSVKYRDNRVFFDWECSENRWATQNRTLNDGSKRQFAEFLLRNEINVLLTRGVNGLYIYAQDEALRTVLKEAGQASENDNNRAD